MKIEGTWTRGELRGDEGDTGWEREDILECERSTVSDLWPSDTKIVPERETSVSSIQDLGNTSCPSMMVLLERIRKNTKNKTRQNTSTKTVTPRHTPMMMAVWFWLPPRGTVSDSLLELDDNPAHVVFEEPVVLMITDRGAQCLLLLYKPSRKRLITPQS